MMDDFLILMRAELSVTGIIFVLLFLALGKVRNNQFILRLTNILLLLNVVVVFFGRQQGTLFGGMFVTSPLIFMQKGILSAGLWLLTLLNYDWLKKSQHLAEFLMLMLSAMLGMFFMISGNNLLLFYLGLELSTIPVAALCNFDLAKKVASEAAMKMILSSAFSSGVLLFGISLIYGVTGTINYEELPVRLVLSPLAILSFILFITGFAFKLSVVPFHLWTADVYQGSPVAVASFLSVISKGAITFIFITFLYKVFRPAGPLSYQLLVILSLATVITGNLFAIRQNNMKRFLAFSSVAQAGFILVGISSGSLQGYAAVIYFILVYVLSNLGGFGVVSIISAATGRESISDYRGLYANNKLLSWVMAICLFSLAGIPPTAGFLGKFFLIFTGAAHAKIWFIAVIALNLVVSLYYYLRVVRAMFMDAGGSPLGAVAIGPVPKTGLLICCAGILFLGIGGWIYEYILSLTQQ